MFAVAVSLGTARVSGAPAGAQTWTPRDGKKKRGDGDVEGRTPPPRKKRQKRKRKKERDRRDEDDVVIIVEDVDGDEAR